MEPSPLDSAKLRQSISTNGHQKKSKGIPPHIAWPASIVALLVLGMGWSFSVVIASRYDGGAQVVDNYYEKAIAWDETAALQKQSDALGWTADITLRNGSEGQLEVVIRDAAGQAVSGLTGTVKGFRPQRTGARMEVALVAAPGDATVYRMTLPKLEHGLWDFEITALRNDDRFATVIRKEL